jgi:hypothetical protein
MTRGASNINPITAPAPRLEKCFMKKRPQKVVGLKETRLMPQLYPKNGTAHDTGLF